MLKKKEAIKKLKEKYDVGINCVGYYNDTNPGFHMSEELIKSCATLGISIDLEIFILSVLLKLMIYKQKNLFTNAAIIKHINMCQYKMPNKSSNLTVLYATSFHSALYKTAS